MSESIAAPRTTETTRPANRLLSAESDRVRSSDRVIAYAILRLSFGVNIMLHGLSRLLAGPSGFLAYLNHYFEHAALVPKSFLPVFGAVLRRWKPRWDSSCCSACSRALRWSQAAW